MHSSWMNLSEDSENMVNFNTFEMRITQHIAYIQNHVEQHKQKANV